MANISKIRKLELLIWTTEYGHTKAKSLIQIPIPNEYLECGCKGLVFCRNNGWKYEKYRGSRLEVTIYDADVRCTFAPKKAAHTHTSTPARTFLKKFLLPFAHKLAHLHTCVRVYVAHTNSLQISSE